MLSIRDLPLPEPAVEAIETGIRVLFGSVFNFLIALGLVFVVVGATVATGVDAGHLGIYGFTAIFIGVLGRAVSYLKLREA